MKKYLSVFKISFFSEFAYRTNFVMWRVRNVLQILLIFFLWDAIFSDPSRQIFGYNREKMLTYVFMILIVKAIVFSVRSIEIPGEISRGDLSNYLIRPISYFKYWFTRDLSSKWLNISFAVVEVTILFLLLKPPFFFQTDIVFLLSALVSVLIAIVLYFLLLLLFSMTTLWFPDQAWGSMFLLFLFTDFLGGGVFPLDVLPQTLQTILYLTPFPYLLYVPIQIYLGNFGVVLTVRAIVIALIWTGVLAVAVRYIWNVGLKSYRAEGR